MGQFKTIFIIYLFIYLLICLFIYLLICLFIYLFIYLLITKVKNTIVFK